MFLKSNFPIPASLENALSIPSGIPEAPFLAQGVLEGVRTEVGW